MRDLPWAYYFGERFGNSSPVIVPRDEQDLYAICAYVQSGELRDVLRQFNRKSSIDNGYFAMAPIDLPHWKKVADNVLPNGLPEPYSDDPTQWLFHGHPVKAEAGATLQVALARLAGHRWPAETETKMRLSAEALDWTATAAKLQPVGSDCILCLPSVGGDAPLADRLRTFLAAAFGASWGASTESTLLTQAVERFKEKPPADLEDWLRHRFFRQHCSLFHDRPFLWHVWDGQKDGFAAVLHYHTLTKGNLEKLTYTVLGDWLARMKDLGDPRRLEAARILQQKLQLILKGERPYDIFVRWKPRECLPIGWDPDLDDGVRQNIRPFVRAGVLREDLSRILKAKDSGTDAVTAPWYHLGPSYGGKPGERINDHHTTLAEKQAAREAARKK